MRTAAQLNADLARIDPSIGPVFLDGDENTGPLINLKDLTGGQIWTASCLVHGTPGPAPVTEYTATWRWTGAGEDSSLNYREQSVPAAIRALKRAVAEGRATRARLTASTVIYDSVTGIDVSPRTTAFESQETRS